MEVHPEGCNRSPAKLSGAGDVGARRSNPRVDGCRKGSRKLTGNGAGLFGKKVSDGAHHGQREQRQPMQYECGGRSVGQPAVELSNAGYPAARTLGHLFFAEKFWPTDARHARGGHHHNASTGQANPDAEIECSIDAGQ